MITVQATNFSFSPSDVTINMGDTVQWVMEQGVHTTTSAASPPVWDSGILSAGSTFQFTFNQPGDFNYTCSLHFQCCNMAGVVHVKPAVTPAAASLVVSAASNVTAGSPFDVTVTAVDVNGHTVTGYTGTVAFSSTDPSPAVLPPNYTFTSSDQGTHMFSGGVTLFTPGAQTLTVHDTAHTSIMGSTTITVTGNGSNPNQKWLTQVYSDLLHRDLDPSGLATWSNLLNQGGSRTQVVTLIESSLEHRTDVVEALYSQLLKRAADSTGLDAFVTFLGNGGTAVEVKAAILGSEKYFHLHGGTADGFLSAVFQDVLNRSVDASGAQSWGMALAGGTSREAVATDILASLESATNEVQSLFNDFLHRAADPSGLNSFTTALKQGTSTEAAIAAIISSDEYFDRAQ
jgi:plastocyanin